jgi:hypothetical protein
MTTRRRNPIAKSLRDRRFKQTIVKNKKNYNRKVTHRNHVQESSQDDE